MNPNQLWQMDVKYGYVAGTGQFFSQISAIDVFDRPIAGCYIGLSATAKSGLISPQNYSPRVLLLVSSVAEGNNSTFVH